MEVTYALSVGVALLSLFGLGVFLGAVSKENLLSYGVKALLAGIVTIAINFLLDID